MGFTCDHETSKETLRMFLESTQNHQFQIFPWGEVHLNGDCVRCLSTITMELCDCRGGVVRQGEILAVPGRCVECLKSLAPRIPTEDEYQEERSIT